MSVERKLLYEFGKFRCDPAEHLLFCDGAPVSLAPKAFEILVIFIQSNGRLMTKEELMQKVWPDTFVEEANLTINISALRKVLGDTTGNQQFIETVPKRGYRFLASVKELDHDASPPLQNPENGVSTSTSVRSVWGRRIGLAAALLLVVVMVVILLSTRSAKLTDKDTIVLSDFANSTGDPVFDDALRQGLSSQLEQSPFLHLLSDDRIAQTMSLMTQPKDSRLTPELARDVCQRTASTAVLDGAITQVGKQYLLTLKAINCSNGESLGSAEAQVNDKDHVLDGLGKVASGIRSQLGESLDSVQKYDAPPENVTTPSLEALKAYSLGYQAMFVKGNSADAIPLFQQAISLDPNFAMAYARMGTCYANINETVHASESLRKAYELRKRVSERENLYIASHYETFVTGDLEAARKIYELSVQTYPRDTTYTNLGLIYSNLGNYEKALVAYKEDLRVNPTATKYANLVSGYLQLNRLREARAAAQEAQDHHIDSPGIHDNLYDVDFVQHDVAGMEREVARLMGAPGFEDQMLNIQADTALCGGNLVQAREFARRASESARKADEKEAAALYQADAALREALVGNRDSAKQRAQAALAVSNGRDTEGLSAIAFGLAGDSTRADSLADDLGKRFPKDTLVQSNYLPTIRAAIWLRARDTAKATEALAAAAPYELGGNFETLSFVLYPVYLRGEVLLAANQGAAAATEFQKIVDHYGVVRNEPIGALVHLELGRAFALSGDKIKAKAAYQEFLTLWKDADSDIPVLKQAKTEYSRLN